MSERVVDEGLIRRIQAAAYASKARRSVLEFEAPMCHNKRCKGSHDMAAAFAEMQHAVVASIMKELRWEAVSRPDVAEHGDSAEDVAVFTLAWLFAEYNVRNAGTFVNAARLIVDAYPALVPALSSFEQ